MPYLTGARGRLHYRRRPLDAPRAVLVLLPGSGQHSGHYHRFAALLGRAEIEAWLFDTAGQGLSEGDPAAPGTLAELTADAAALLGAVRAERPAEPLVLMGHSLGAATALGLLAGAAPALDGLVLCGTPPRAITGAPPPGLPVLAVHGVDDRRTPIDPVRGWTAGHESVHLCEYSDAGHDLLHEPVHAKVGADIAAWVRDVAEGRPHPDR
ncbi:alpha/beta fold hydrolase [Nocardia sp. NPDC050697]|uniref:alpha/beta hydrolase n=1 Tax=Nocardia sp. NPDC050697 TaxID=3155158 RepID=UPI0033CEB1FC